MQGLSLRRIPLGLPGAGIPVVRLHYSADPTNTEEKIAALRSKYTSDARYRREMEIQYEALEGELLYPEFSRERNICTAFDVSDPDFWTIWMGLDPHPRTAHAMAWEAFNKHGDQVVCGEFWPEFGTRYGPQDGIRWKVKDYAEAIQLFESDSESKPSPFEWAKGKRLRIFRRIMDTYGAAVDSDEGEDFFESYRKLGIELTRDAELKNVGAWKVRLNFDRALKGQDNLARAQDSIGRAMLGRVNEKTGKPERPAMMIFEDCYELIEEFENVRFPEGTPERPADERPITYQKHVIDCLHYIQTARPRFVMPRRERRSSFQPIYPETGY